MVTWLEERYYPVNVKSWLVYIVVLLARLSEDEVEGILKRYPFDNYSIQTIKESRQVPFIAEHLTAKNSLAAHEIDQLLGDWSKENIVYLLLLVREETAWDNLVHYLDLKEKVRIEINGNDLKELGIKEGPIYRLIFDELYRLKLDEVIYNGEEEIQQVKKWMEDGRFANGMVN